MGRTDDIKISAWMPAALVGDLAQIAQNEDRTFSAEVRRAVKTYVARNTNAAPAGSAGNESVVERPIHVPA